jgi:hypothetical protein
VSTCCLLPFLVVQDRDHNLDGNDDGDYGDVDGVDDYDVDDC